MLADLSISMNRWNFGVFFKLSLIQWGWLKWKEEIDKCFCARHCVAQHQGRHSEQLIKFRKLNRMIKPHTANQISGSNNYKHGDVFNRHRHYERAEMKERTIETKLQNRMWHNLTIYTRWLARHNPQILKCWKSKGFKHIQTNSQLRHSFLETTKHVI